MRIPIKVHYNYALDCLGNSICAVASWMGKNYELLYSNSWRYNLQEIDLNLISNSGDYIPKTDSQRTTGFEIMEIYHGFKVSEYTKDSFIETKNDIIQILKTGFPVAIYIDSYYCPWFKPKYRSIHSNHYCLVIGVDDEEKGFYISDAQMAKNGSYLPFTEYCQGWGEYFTFESVEAKSVPDWKYILNNAVEQLKVGSYNVFNDIRKFGREINEYIPSFHKWQKSGIHEEFIKNSCRIREFNLSIQYLYNMYNIPKLLYLSQRLDIAAARWMSIYGMFLKTYFLDMDSLILNRISTKIVEAADDDESILNDICNLISDDDYFISRIKNTVSVNNDLCLSDYYYVDLSKHYNNTAFYSSNKKSIDIGFSYSGRYFLQDSLPQNNIWTVNDMKFNFPDIDLNVYDNISCSGEKIEVNISNFSHVIILGSSELGDHVDYISVHYTDQTSEKIPINFSGWRASKPIFGETIAWEGISHSDVEKNICMPPEPAYIYISYNTLKYNKPIKTIELPMCPNIHIFAITLAN